MRNLFSILLVLFTLNGFSQISHGGSPISSTISLNPNISDTILSSIDIQPYIEEDLVTDKHKDIAWRFGINRSVNFDLSNSGTWETLANGDRIWRLKITSPLAKTINLNYSSFFLPVGSNFFVYNKNGTLGAFTNSNNKASGEFATNLLKGDYVVLEYFEPTVSQGQGNITVSSVIHGYRDPFDHNKVFGSSAGCNINAICDELLWGNEIRSIVMMLTAGNTRKCSGTLVNNTLQDGTPYILTANHCNVLTNSIFMFNYLSPSCHTNTDGPTSQTIAGCTIRASNGPTDFVLAELSSTPPTHYDVFYSGWSNVNTPPSNVTGIHHPRGDVMKISHDYDSLVEDNYNGQGPTHWRVLDWNTGTTETGSSGSGLFDRNHRLIGQLQGGVASCSNDASDYYGKFSYSWDNDPNSSKQLKFWLDPNGSGATEINGYYPNGLNHQTDAVLLEINNIGNYVCSDSISPEIIIRNQGSNNLTSLIVNYELDGNGASQTNWSGNLTSYGVTTIALPKTSISNGPHTLKVFLTAPNGTNDEDNLNDSLNIEFYSSNEQLNAILYLNTDDFGSELSWFVRNSTNSPLLSGEIYQDVTGGQLITENLCLFDSCFTFVLKDAVGDGYCCLWGSGSFQLVDNHGDTIASDVSFNGDSISFPFCMSSSVGIADLNDIDNRYEIYPNPSTGIFTVSSKFPTKNQFEIKIFDMLGHHVYHNQGWNDKKLEIDMKNIERGIYLVTISSENEKFVSRLVIN